MRIKWLLPILIGMLLGFTTPVSSATSVAYTLLMLPASGNAGEKVTLTCGWHDQACTSGAIGNYLDWSATSASKSTTFRGIFTRAGSSYETNRLVGKRQLVKSGPDVCEIQDVKVYDISTNKLRAWMRFVHTPMNSTNDFPIATSGSGTYNSKSIGAMINDLGSSCKWTGYHSHAGYPSDSISGTTKTRQTSHFPSGDYCRDVDNCTVYKTFQNNSPSHWTHKFTWTGP